MKMSGTPIRPPEGLQDAMVRAVCSKGKDPDSILVDAVARAEKGQVDADLGGVIKQRIARPGQGKSGGYRTIIFFRRGHGFAPVAGRHLALRCAELNLYYL